MTARHDPFRARDDDPLARVAAARPRDPGEAAIEGAFDRVRGRVLLRRGRRPRPARARWLAAAVVCAAVGGLAWMERRATGPAPAPRQDTARAVPDGALPDGALPDGDAEAAPGSVAVPVDASALRAVKAALAGDGLARQRLREGGAMAVRALAAVVGRDGAPGPAAALRRRMAWPLDAEEVAIYAHALTSRGRPEDGPDVAGLLWSRGGSAGADALAVVAQARDDLIEAIVEALDEGAQRAPYERLERVLLPVASRSAVALAALLSAGRADQFTIAPEGLDLELLAAPRVQEALAGLGTTRRRSWLHRAEHEEALAVEVVAAAAWPGGVAALERVARSEAPRGRRDRAVDGLVRMEGADAVLALARLGFDDVPAPETARRARQALAVRVPEEAAALELLARRRHAERWAACLALAEGGDRGRQALVRLAQRGTTRRQAIAALGASPGEAADEDLALLAESGGVATYEAIGALVERLGRSATAERVLWDLLAGRRADEVVSALAAVGAEDATADGTPDEAHARAVVELLARIADDPLRGAGARRWREASRRPKSGTAVGPGPAARAARPVRPAPIPRPPY